MRYLTIIVLASILSLNGCAAVQIAARVAVKSINEAAKIWCEEFTVSREMKGVNAKKWCSVRENLEPFVNFLKVQDEKLKLNN